MTSEKADTGWNLVGVDGLLGVAVKAVIHSHDYYGIGRVHGAQIQGSSTGRVPHNVSPLPAHGQPEATDELGDTLLSPD